MLGLLGIGGNVSSIDIGDNIANSLMLDSGSSQYLSRTFGTPTIQDTFTFSIWIKRAKLSTLMNLFGVSTNNSIGFPTADTFVATFAGTARITSLGLWRDPTGFEHFVYKQTTGAGEAFVNNVSVGTTATVSAVFNTAVAHQLFAANTTAYSDLYASMCYFIDGQALTPSSFGRVSADTGQWVNKTYTGTYGNNGFKLDFTNGSALGTDSSGNGNNWTLNGGITSANQYTDTPTNNFAVGNPLAKTVGGGSAQTYSKGNLTVSSGNASYGDTGFSTLAIPTTGKWWAEFKFLSVGGSGQFVGIVPVDNVSKTRNSSNYTGDFSGEYGYGRGSTVAYKNIGGSLTATGTTTPVANDVARLEYDADNHSMAIYLNNALQSIPGFTSIPAVPYVWSCSGATTAILVNMGNTAPVNTPTAGFKALCTANLPTPIIAKVSSGFAQVTTTEDNIYSTLAAARSGWSAYVDIVKNRAAAESWAWQFSHDASNEYAVAASSLTYQAKRAMSGSNTWLGRSIRIGGAYGTAAGSVSHTNGADTTVTHNVGVSARQLILLFKRAGGTSVPMYHADATSGELLDLCTTAADTASTSIKTVLSTSFKIDTAMSTGTYDYLVCSELSGFFSLAKQVGNAAADGTFGYMGVSPVTSWFKSITVADDHRIYSSLTPVYNVCGGDLRLNTNAAETTVAEVDLVSTGVKTRITTTPNAAQTYVTATWGTPTKYSTAR